jgi:hypothetical protein
MTETEHLAELDETTRRYADADAALEKARQASAAAVLAALRDGVAPTTVAEKSPFTPTYVRNLARRAGIPAATTRRSPRRRSAP